MGVIHLVVVVVVVVVAAVAGGGGDGGGAVTAIARHLFWGGLKVEGRGRYGKRKKVLVGD